VDREYIDELFSNKSKQYEDKIENIKSSISQLEDSNLQLKLLGRQIKEFVDLSIPHAEALFIKDTNYEKLVESLNAFKALRDALNQISNLANDRPSVLISEKAKLTNSIELIKETSFDLLSIKELIYAREDDLKEIEKELKAQNASSKKTKSRRKTGTRPHKIKDIRKVKAKMNKENQEQENEK
tara:strand:+ start:1901 stop:2452 length:552 start_codon:yes stop_codon:yes gene_type:complete